MARVNIDILGISALKWTRMGEFNSDDHYIYYCGQIPWKKWSSPHSPQESPKCSSWVKSQKWQNDFCSFSSRPFNITIIHVYAPTTDAKKAEAEWIYEDLQELLELTSKKDVIFLIGEWKAKVRSRETPRVTDKFGLGAQNEAWQNLTEFCQENSIVIANTCFQQHERWLYTWTSTEGQHQNQIDYILCSQRWRSSTQSAKTRLGADDGSDHELIIAKFRLKLK